MTPVDRQHITTPGEGRSTDATARSWWSGPPGGGANSKDSGRSESGKGKATSLRPVHDKGET